MLKYAYAMLRSGVGGGWWHCKKKQTVLHPNLGNGTVFVYIINDCYCIFTALPAA